MKDKLTFIETKEMYLKTLEQYVPVVDRVHGDNHPEFHEVKRVFEIMRDKMKETDLDKPVLNEEFAKLRDITSNYFVPEDVCESFEAVYQMLSKLDESYYAG